MTIDEYDDDNLLLLSGIQHFAFCQRQWALIHIEKQWAENMRTVEGKQLHERADDPYFMETRHNVKIVRSIPLVSRRLGMYGVADVIEYYHDNEADSTPQINIVEYKRGKPKPDDRDEVQLCAQAICLEEMLGIELKYGYFFYGETKHRCKVNFDDKLREKVKNLAIQMHDFFKRGITPAPIKDKKCRCCSMKELCLPVLGKKENTAGIYLKRLVKEAKKEAAGE
jgi:CRISPR-associated exonuclease Cas4